MGVLKKVHNSNHVWAGYDRNVNYAVCGRGSTPLSACFPAFVDLPVSGACSGGVRSRRSGLTGLYRIRSLLMSSRACCPSSPAVFVRLPVCHLCLRVSDQQPI